MAKDLEQLPSGRVGKKTMGPPGFFSKIEGTIGMIIIVDGGPKGLTFFPAHFQAIPPHIIAGLVWSFTGVWHPSVKRDLNFRLENVYIVVEKLYITIGAVHHNLNFA